MTFEELLKQKNISIYMLAKKSDIPYTTINDLVHGRTNIANMSLKNAISIANVLDVNVYELLNIQCVQLIDFRYFRNTILSSLKRDGANSFIQRIISEKLIDFYYKNNGLDRTLYLLALLDYLCRIKERPIYTKRYNSYRKLKLKRPLFVGGDSITFNSVEEAEQELGITVIPEFGKFNIIEEDVFNVA